MDNTEAITILSPGGELHYCENANKNIVKKGYVFNPDLSNGIEDWEQELSETIYLTNEDLINGLALQYKSYYVQFICLIDFSIHLFLFYITDFFFLNIFISVISYGGFLSAQSFNREGFVIYLTYQYINVFFNIIYFIVYMYSHCSVDLQNLLIKYYHIDPEKLFDPTYSIYLLVVSLFQISITYYLQSFYNDITTNNYLNSNSESNSESDRNNNINIVDNEFDLEHRVMYNNV